MSRRPCPLCAGTIFEQVHDDAWACTTCGSVTCSTLYQEAGPSGVADGWQARAAYLAAAIPKHAVDPGRVSIDRLAEMLGAGPLYLETPNTREPALSLAHFFTHRAPTYYEPATLGIALAMAGADDLSIDEVAGMITCVAEGGGARLTYAEAVATTGIEPPHDVAGRMAARFAPRPPEVLGDVVPGACFVCGGVRRAWRTVTICETCSTLTTQTPGPLLDDLAASVSSVPDGAPVQFFAPDMRTSSPDDCERVVLASSWMLDEPVWCAALLMAGADAARARKHSGALELQGRAFGPPRRKTLDEARELIVKGAFREARHTVGIWNTPTVQASKYERWLAGEDCADVEHLRAEATRDRVLASAAVEAMQSLMNQMEARQDDGDDWHADPYLNGLRMGAAATWQRAQVAVSMAWMAIVQRAVRDE